MLTAGARDDLMSQTTSNFPRAAMRTDLTKPKSSKYFIFQLRLLVTQFSAECARLYLIRPEKIRWRSGRLLPAGHCPSRQTLALKDLPWQEIYLYWRSCQSKKARPVCKLRNYGQYDNKRSQKQSWEVREDDYASISCSLLEEKQFPSTLSLQPFWQINSYCL